MRYGNYVLEDLKANDNEIQGSMKNGEFITKLSEHPLMKRTYPVGIVMHILR
jgi:hypothetical protein